MPATIIEFTPAPGTLWSAEKSRQTNTPAEAKLAPARAARKPEARLWKLTALSTASLGNLELAIFLLFLLVALATVIACFAELSFLIQKDSIGQIAAKAISGSAE
jgi:hypothetical protein